MSEINILQSFTMKVYNDKLERLVSLQGGDPGFFVLAGQSYIESYLRMLCDDTGPNSYYSFPSLISDVLAPELEKLHEKVLQSDRELFSRLHNMQTMANRVRHQFDALDAVQAANMLHNLKEFCQRAGLGELEGLKKLESAAEIWEEERSKHALLQENIRLKFENRLSTRQSQDLAKELEELKAVEQDVGRLEEELKAAVREAESLKDSNEKSQQRQDELRELRHHLTTELKKVKAELAGSREIQEYLQQVTARTLTTRTQKDYEHSLLELTHEQKLILDQIGTGDFLILGGAGTGKTLVLIQALRRQLESNRNELSELAGEIQGRSLLLTYSKTLARYDRYVSGVMNGDEPLEISTVDRFLLDVGEQLRPDLEVAYDYPKVFTPLFAEKHESLLAEDETLFPEKFKVLEEIEDFILAGGYSREQYIEEMIPRRGREHRLSKKQRVRVWERLELYVTGLPAEAEEEEKRLKVSRGTYLSLLLEEVIKEKERGSFQSDVDTLYVDEVQDLKLVELRLLKQLACRGVVMAGDPDQTIYTPGFSFRKAEISVTGKTRYLTVNFRNTREINRLAESYRELSNLSDMRKPVDARRTGPFPELFSLTKTADMEKQLVDRVRFYIEKLHYAPSNIAVLTVNNKNCERVMKLLEDAGVRSASIRDEEFEFDEAHSVRVSTLHSGKGLDFPVVILYLPAVPFANRSLDSGARDSIYRNLLYVAMTRAMDQLTIIMKQKPDQPCFTDIEKLFQGQSPAPDSD